MFSCLSLFNLTKNKVKKVYQNHWSETNCLPKILQKDLLEEWLRCDEVCPELMMPDPALMLCCSSWEELLPICPQTFVYLMCHPPEVPSFVFEKNHIIYDYYTKSDYECTYKSRLCSNCFPLVSRYYYPYSANLWLRDNIIYKHCKSHSVINGDEVLEKVIWENNSWCDNCSITPLFKLLDDNDCYSEYDFHHSSKRRWDSDSDDSCDNYNCSRSENIIKGNRSSDEYFKTCIKYD